GSGWRPRRPRGTVVPPGAAVAVPGVAWSVLVGAAVRVEDREGLRGAVRQEGLRGAAHREGRRGAGRREEPRGAGRRGRPRGAGPGEGGVAGGPDGGGRAPPGAAPAVCSGEEASGGRSVRREGEGVGRRGGGSGRSGLSWGGGRRWEGFHRDAWGEVRPGPGGGRKVHPEEVRPGPGGVRKAHPEEDRGGDRGLPAEARSERGGGVLVAHSSDGGWVVGYTHTFLVR